MAEKTYEIRITRQDPDTGEKTKSFYQIPVIPGMTVLEALWYIVDRIDGSLSFRYSCRGGVCGSCSMQINREVQLACQVQLSMLPQGTIIIEPLPRLSV
ncbi:2Fe-2S iron-sulfur cluster binding domain-containing protein, partial [bacterium]|nr:2Fe-2S iron-sulfur cluster binding domain-containing protein [bacterium]